MVQNNNPQLGEYMNINDNFKGNSNIDSNYSINNSKKKFAINVKYMALLGIYLVNSTIISGYGVPCSVAYDIANEHGVVDPRRRSNHLDIRNLRIAPDQFRHRSLLGKRIFIVTNNPATLEFTSFLIEKKNGEVLVAKNREQAATLIEKHSYDLVLVDPQVYDLNTSDLVQSLGGRDGVAVVRPVPVLILDGEVNRACLQSGICGKEVNLSRNFNSTDFYTKVFGLIYPN